MLSHHRDAGDEQYRPEQKYPPGAGTKLKYINALHNSPREKVPTKEANQKRKISLAENKKIQLFD